MKKIFSFDAETNGLWGKAFSIGVVILEDGKETKRFVARCPINEEVDEWVGNNVIPQMEGIEITHNNYEEMLKCFIDFYLENKEEADIIVHMGLPVEARLFIDAHNLGYLGDWDAPYPLIDVSAIPSINTSVDAYAKEHNIEIPTFEGGTHNPLYDSMVTALVYYNYMRGVKND